MATELSVTLERGLGCAITAIEILNAPSLADLARRIVDSARAESPPDRPRSQTDGQRDGN